MKINNFFFNLKYLFNRFFLSFFIVKYFLNSISILPSGQSCAGVVFLCSLMKILIFHFNNFFYLESTFNMNFFILKIYFIKSFNFFIQKDEKKQNKITLKEVILKKNNIKNFKRKN